MVLVFGVLIAGVLGSAGFAVGYAWPQLTRGRKRAPPFAGEWWQLPSGGCAELLDVGPVHIRYRLDGGEHSVPREQLEQHGRRWAGPPELVDLTEQP